MNCACCGKALSGGLDTFGDAGAEVCHGCWCAAEPEGVDLREQELQETIRLARRELKFLDTLEEDFEPDERDFSERHFFEAELANALRELDDLRVRKESRLEKWRAAVNS